MQTANLLIIENIGLVLNTKNALQYIFLPHLPFAPWSHTSSISFLACFISFFVHFMTQTHQNHQRIRAKMSVWRLIHHAEAMVNWVQHDLANENAKFQWFSRSRGGRESWDGHDEPHLVMEVFASLEMKREVMGSERDCEASVKVDGGGMCDAMAGITFRLICVVWSLVEVMFALKLLLQCILQGTSVLKCERWLFLLRIVWAGGFGVVLLCPLPLLSSWFVSTISLMSSPSTPSDARLRSPSPLEQLQLIQLTQFFLNIKKCLLSAPCTLPSLSPPLSIPQEMMELDNVGRLHWRDWLLKIWVYFMNPILTCGDSRAQQRWTWLNLSTK